MGFKLDDHYEKDFFTVQELAKQWDCTSKDIDYLINETGELRLGMKVDDRLVTCVYPASNESDIQSLLRCIYHEDDVFGKVRLNHAVTMDTIDEALQRSLSSALDKTEDGCCAAKLNYVYKDRLVCYYSNQIRDKKGKSMRAYITIQDLSGKRYVLMDISETDKISNRITFGRLYEVEFSVIPREERDRFVMEHSGNIGSSAIPTLAGGSITSKYLNELQIRINHLEKKFPQWRTTQKIVQNAGNLQDWIKTETGSDTREVELIKKALIEIFPELKKGDFLCHVTERVTENHT
jgi:hypothetical protein